MVSPPICFQKKKVVGCVTKTFRISCPLRLLGDRANSPLFTLPLVVLCILERLGHWLGVIHTSGGCTRVLEQVTLWESEPSQRILKGSHLPSCLQLSDIPWVNEAAPLLGYILNQRWFPSSVDAQGLVGFGAALERDL